MHGVQEIIFFSVFCSTLIKKTYVAGTCKIHRLLTFILHFGRYFRPSEVDNLRGNATKAKEILGWQPKVNFKQLVKMMVDADLEKANREKVLVEHGYMDSHQQP